MTPICLGSASPRRRELLTQMGMDFTIHVPHIIEQLTPSLSPKEQVCSLSTQKAAAVFRERQREDEIILTADTLVFLDNMPLGKPKSEEEAREMLKRLSGRTHTVMTGVTVRQGEKIITGAEATEVTFCTLSEENICQYVKTGEPMDKAGSYGLQGLGGVFVTSIKGDYSNVIGLPIPYTARVLSLFGILPFGRYV